MSVDKTVTPLPTATNAPVRVELPQWFDLAADDRERLLRHSNFGDQHVDIEYIGGRPEPDVALQLSSTVTEAGRGEVDRRDEYDTTAIGGFTEPASVGPIATSSMTWNVRNRSSTPHTQSGGTPYQAFINYSVRPLTVLEKLQRGIPLTQTENELRQQYNLDTYQTYNVTPETDPFYDPNLEGKVVIEDDSITQTFDIGNAGESNAVAVLDQNVRNDEVLYVTGISVNSQEYGYADDLTIQFSRRGGDTFYEIESFGMPGQPYTADLHIPFLDDVTVSAYAENALTDVDITVEYARARRTLIEKALYGLQNGVKSNDAAAQNRMNAYREFRDLMRAGMPATTNVDAVLSRAGVTVNGSN